MALAYAFILVSWALVRDCSSVALTTYLSSLSSSASVLLCGLEQITTSL